MSYALFSKAKGWVSNGYGTCDDITLTEITNAIRQFFYSWYAELPVALDADECFQVQTFCVDCNRCDDVYRGITLPRHIETVEAMWFNNYTVQLFDRWRTWQQGMGEPHECNLAKYDVGHAFPTERDLIPNQPRVLWVKPMNSADRGKTVTIRGTAITGSPFEETLTLGAEPVKTTLPLRSIAKPGGVVKEPTVGRVIIGEDDGRILSYYAPDETVPAYTRIKITGLPAGCQFVNIRAARRFVELFDDFDVVETGNQNVWEAMARYLRLSKKPVKDADELRSMASDLSLAQKLMLGDKSRQTGKSTQADVRIMTPQLSRRTLRRTWR